MIQNDEFCHVFDSHGADSVYSKYDGMKCKIVRPLSKFEADEEVGKMFRIMLSNGKQFDAFDDEIIEGDKNEAMD